MTPKGYAFIHPLLGHNDICAGYLLEHAPDIAPANPDGHVFEHPQFTELDHRLPWFVPATRLETTVPERIIATFQASKAQETCELEATLRQARRRLALETSASNKLPATGTWDHLLITISQARTQPPFSLYGLSTRTQLVATGVQNHSDRSWALANACTLTTGEYLMTRSISGKKSDTTRQKMLRLLALIAQDADTGKLDEIFRQEAKLSYSLLRLVNSAAIAPRTPITSFAQAINLLGRRQLERWLQLLIYADPENGHNPNPLLYKAAVRGRLMELLAPHLQPPPELPNLTDSAFMIGCFSLLDVLLNISMPEILQQLPLATSMNNALAHHTGEAGRLLLALEAMDRRNLAIAEQVFGELALDPTHVLDAQMQALSWAGRIHA